MGLTDVKRERLEVKDSGSHRSLHLSLFTFHRVVYEPA